MSKNRTELTLPLTTAILSAACGADGRDHHGNHHCSVMIGPRIRSSMIGGLELQGVEYQAQAIHSQTKPGGATGDGEGRHRSTYCVATGRRFL